MKLSRHISTLMAAAALVLAPTCGFAANYPSKPVRIIVPFAAGGAADMTTRLAAKIAEKYLGQSITVENRPGGGGVTGYTEVARSRPDGYTLSEVGPSIVISPLTKKTSFTTDSFIPIVNMVFEPETIACLTKRFRTWEELVEFSKANPSAVKVSVSGAMASDHLAVLRVLKKTGMKWVIVPTNGSAQGITAMLGGHVNLTVVSPSELSEQVRSGEVSYLLTLAAKRLEEYPALPIGFEKGVEVADGSWRGIVAPKGTPEDVIAKIEDAFVKTFHDPKFAEAYGKAGLPSNMWMNREDFTKQVEEQKTDIAAVIAEIDVKGRK
ncbi:tripartite tricarboxylate transporter substrate binding protein [Pyramidobacter sp.]